ncbi:hypothetical protein C8Q79DRAFT_1012532 [Trametes meyenii]|nr:hypothetical protein C8Q79DRAFT_1012532 [Trametes meyenii]
MFTEDNLEYEAGKVIKSLQAWIDYRKRYEGDVPLSIASESKDPLSPLVQSLNAPVAAFIVFAVSFRC